MATSTTNARHDSPIEHKLLDHVPFASFMNSSSPLSSVPSDMDDMFIPDLPDLLDCRSPDNTSTHPGLDDVFTSVNQNSTSASASHDIATASNNPDDTFASGSQDSGMSFDPEFTNDGIRRSCRKRKAPSRFGEDVTATFQHLQLDEDATSIIPAKRQKSDPEFTPKQPQKARNKALRRSLPENSAAMMSRAAANFATLEISPTATSPYPQAASIPPQASSPQIQAAQPQTPTLQSQTPAVSPETDSREFSSRVVKLKVDKEKLRQFATSQSNGLEAQSNQQATMNGDAPSQHDYLASLSVDLLRSQDIPTSQKPKPCGHPEIWAEDRVSLCECLPGLYEAYNSAYYGSQGVARCFMVDGNSHPRDVLDENVIILRAGGRMVQDEQTGKMVQGDDQVENNQSLAVKNAIIQQSPIAIICGNKNTLVPTQMPHKYNSLSWYKPTHVWSEMDQGKRRGEVAWLEIMKYRLEKLDPDTPSWWVPEDHQPIVRLGELESALKQCCSSCSNEHDQIYLAGWMCLTPGCKDFWKLADGSRPSSLHYDPRFLKQKTTWANEQPPYPIRYPVHVPSDIVGEDYKYHNQRGMCCPECGQCVPRVRWEGWNCDSCGYEYLPKMTMVPAREVQDRKRPVTNAYASSYDVAAPNVEVSVHFSFNYRWMKYRIRISDNDWAEVVHGIANKVVREEQDGPNAMWEHLQQQSHGMVRRKFGASYMNSFTMNYGMPYKFIAAGSTLPFTDAPKPITETRSRLNWADEVTSEVPVSQDDKFNELYVVGYFEGQKMEYHDDGEAGLGSTVATLSLGAPAEMSFRPKSVHYHGMREVTRTVKNGKGKAKQNLLTLDDDLLTMENPLPGFYKIEERVAALKKLKDANLSKEALDEKLATIAANMELAQKSGSARRPNNADWIKLWLGHGDIVIMRGSKFQKYFEHKVEPKGIMRYALTCRTIQEGHLKPSELPDYEVEPDDGNYDGSRIAS